MSGNCFVNFLTDRGETLVNLKKINVITFDKSNSEICVDGNCMKVASDKLLQSMFQYMNSRCGQNVKYISPYSN